MNDTPSAAAAPAASVSQSSAASIPQIGTAAKIGFALLLALVTVLGFSPALGGEFLYDDIVLVQENPRLASFGAVLRGFIEPHWAFEDPRHADAIGFWRPLTLLALALGRVLGGGSALGFHLLSIGLHVLAALAVWRFAGRLLSSWVYGLLAALLFALHPVHVESVAWISAVNDPLYALFAVLSLDAFVTYRQGGSRGIPLAAGLWLLLALFAKEQALAVLPIAIALDFGLHASSESSFRRTFGRAYGPLVVALLVYVLVRMFVFQSVLGGLDRSAASFGLSFARSATFQVEMLGTFLSLLAWPAELSVFRMVRPELPPGDATLIVAALAVVAWLAATVIAWQRRARLALACLLFVPAALSPLIVRFESAGAFPISDRYLYLGALGFLVLVAHVARTVLPHKAALGALLLLAVPLGLTTYERSAIFQDEETFFRAGAADSPRNPYVRWGMGRVLLNQYEARRDKELLDEAFFHYMTSLALGTDYGKFGPKLSEDAPYGRRGVELAAVVNGTPPEHRKRDYTVMVSVDDRLQANLGQGYCYLYLAELPPEHDYDAPLVIFEETAKQWPNSFHALTGLGSVHLARGEYAEARQALAQATRLNPAHAAAWHNLGLTLTAEGDWDGARTVFQKAEELRPGHLEDILGIAKTSIEAKRFDLAERRLSEAIRLHPESTPPSYWMGMLEAHKRNFRQALTWFDRVLVKEPRNGDAQLQRGKVLFQLGEPSEAIKALQVACENLPDSYEAHYQVASLLLQSQSGSTIAFDYIERAYQLSAPGDERRTLHDILVQIAQNKPDLCMSYSVLDGGRGDYQLALDWTTRVLAIPNVWQDEPNRDTVLAQVYHARGKYLQGLGEDQLARESYETAVQHNPEHFWSFHNLAVLLVRMRAPSGLSVAPARRALELLPEAGVRRDLRKAVEETLQAIAKGVEPPMGPQLPDTGTGAPEDDE
ncbi:MAG: tetratricopeptide repeat protein [bacterium]|nr:tetratricopeptide repeat protein [bacterium]